MTKLLAIYQQFIAGRSLDDSESSFREFVISYCPGCATEFSNEDVEEGVCSKCGVDSQDWRVYWNSLNN